jgi:hypothetical protein
MKILILSFVFVLTAFFGSSQTSSTQSNSPVFFAQCMINLTDQTDLVALENQLRAVPYVGVVRVDISTQRLFLITKDLNSFTSVEFTSWMGTYSTSYSCLQIGLHGIDSVNPFPFTNCQD